MPGALSQEALLVPAFVGCGSHPEGAAWNVGPIRIFGTGQRRRRAAAAQRLERPIPQLPGPFGEGRVAAGEEVQRPDHPRDQDRVFGALLDQRQRDLRHPEHCLATPVLADPARAALEHVQRSLAPAEPRA